MSPISASVSALATLPLSLRARLALEGPTLLFDPEDTASLNLLHYILREPGGLLSGDLPNKLKFDAAEIRGRITRYADAEEITSVGEGGQFKAENLPE